MAFHSPILAPMPPQEGVFFGAVHFKHTHSRYPSTLLVTYLVQRYARSGRHPKNALFLAQCISNTPIVGFHQHFWWHTWCRGMRVRGATPRTPRTHFSGIVHYKHTHDRYAKKNWCYDWCRGMRVRGATPRVRFFLALCIQTHMVGIQNTFGGIFGAEVCAFGAPPQECAVFWHYAFKHTHGRYPKHFWWHIWCRGMRVRGATPRVRCFLALCVQTHPW